jgi:hypothetical protein
MTLKQAAACFGEGMMTRKLQYLMQAGTYRYKRLHRQSFVFDLRALPAGVAQRMRQAASS